MWISGKARFAVVESAETGAEVEETGAWVVVKLFAPEAGTVVAGWDQDAAMLHLHAGLEEWECTRVPKHSCVGAGA